MSKDCIAHFYTCAFAGEKVMLSYSMWYNIRQVSVTIEMVIFMMMMMMMMCLYNIRQVSLIMI